MKKIKCEWCGYHYDPLNHTDCPKCGGANHFVQEEIPLIEQKPVETQKIEDSKKNHKFGWLIFFIILLLIILTIIPGFFVTYETASSDEDIYKSFDSIIANISDLKETTNNINQSVDKMNYLSNELKKMNANTDYCGEGFYTEDKPIEINGSKFYVPYIEYTSNASSYIRFSVYTFVEKPLYDDVDIELYMVSDSDRYRITTEKDSFFRNDIKDIDNILKYEGITLINGKTSIKKEDYIDGIFKSILFVIDGEEYEVSLRNKDVYNQGIIEDLNIPLSEKIEFDGNAIYLDNFKFSNTTYNRESKIELIIGTSIKNFNNKNISFELEDDNDYRYKLYEREYFCNKSAIVHMDDLLKTSLNDIRIETSVFTNEKNFKNLIMTIDGQEFKISLTK